MAGLHDNGPRSEVPLTGEEYCTAVSLAAVANALVPQDQDGARAAVAQYRQAAEILRLCGRWTEAVEAARKAIALDPHDPGGRNLLVDILLERGEYEDVIRESSSWLLLQPYNSAALEALAKAYWYCGELAAAQRVMNRLLELNPYEPAYRYQRGVLHQYQGAWGRAMEDFLAVLEAAPGPELRVHAEAAAASLERWQLRLIAMLIVEDPLFRIQFDQDPEGAVNRRGFRLTEAGAALLRCLPHGSGIEGVGEHTGFLRQ